MLHQSNLPRPRSGVSSLGGIANVHADEHTEQIRPIPQNATKFS